MVKKGESKILKTKGLCFFLGAVELLLRCLMNFYIWLMFLEHVGQMDSGYRDFQAATRSIAPCVIRAPHG